MLLQNGKTGTQCGDPELKYPPAPRKVDIIIRDRWRRGVKRRSAMGDQPHAKMIPVNVVGGQAIYGSCTSNSFSKYHIKWNSNYQFYPAFEKNGALPPITVGGFYMPRYGGTQSFDPNKNYMGFVIMAIHANGQWYADHSKTF